MKQLARSIRYSYPFMRPTGTLKNWATFTGNFRTPSVRLLDRYFFIYTLYPDSR